MRKLTYRSIIACSGGPDSMALLDMAYKSGSEIAVAHVNYHHRHSANRDERIVRKYCEERNIPFYKKDVRSSKLKGNFQDQAREVRYAFFKEVSEKEKAERVLTAHHFDDSLETYLLQRQHGGGFSWYGIKRKTVIKGVTIYRPLLKYTKEELRQYCEKHKVPYGIDESNLSDDYQRNILRHDVLDKMSLEQKKELGRKIDELNRIQQKEIREVKKYIGRRREFLPSEILEYPLRERMLRMLVKEDLSRNHTEELLRQIEESDSFFQEIEGVCIVKEYGKISFFRKKDDYSITFEKIEYGNYGCFALRKKGKTIEALTLQEEDLPIAIRNVRAGDEIRMRFGRKKVSRFLIDRKISRKERMEWPVVVNRQGEVIFVSGLGCDVAHHSIKPDLFVIKL